MRAVIVTMLSIPIVARAEPATQPAEYLQFGVALGPVRAESDTSTSFFETALAVAGGYQLADGPGWLHAAVVFGGLTDLDEASGYYLELRGGIQGRGCVLSKIVCGLATIDLGVRRGVVHAEFDHVDTTAAVIVPQLGLDIGWDRFRVRPSLELGLGTDLSGLALSLAVAVAW